VAESVRETAILITGAASGIGRATAIALGLAGRRVIVCDWLEGAARETCAQVERAGGEAELERLDLRDAGAIAAMVARAVPAHGLAAIIHSAAFVPQQSFRAATLSDFEQVMTVNVRAAFVLAKAGASVMADRGGSLVFLTSGAGLLASAADLFQLDFSLYGASKAALDRWALGIAAELLESGIAVTTITPRAFVATPGTARLDLGKAPPMKRVEVDEVGRAVAWLASEPRLDLAGQRLSAVEFGSAWGLPA